MTGQRVTAQWATDCTECDTRIQPGEEIELRTGWAHVACPDDQTAAKRPVCDRCWQEQSATGTCGCEDE